MESVRSWSQNGCLITVLWFLAIVVVCALAFMMAYYQKGQGWDIPYYWIEAWDLGMEAWNWCLTKLQSMVE